MSFFITKLARKATEPKRGAFFSNPSRGLGKQQSAALQRLGCAACPLNKATDVITPKMLPTLKKGGAIYFLAEAPGCFTEGTPVFKEDDISFIEDKIAGQLDYCGGKIKKDLQYKVTDYPIIRFRPKKFPEYACTEQHELLIASKTKYLRSGVITNLGGPRFVAASNLIRMKGKHYLCVPKIDNNNKKQVVNIKPFKRHRRGYNDVYIPDEILIDEDIAFALGMFIGDGTASKDGVTFCLSVGFKERYVEKLVSIINRFGHPPVVDKNLPHINVRTSARTLGSFFRFHFYTAEGDKKIPDFILHSPPSVISMFIFGWFVTDGKKGTIGSKKGLRITTSSKLAGWQAIKLGLSANVLLGLNPERPSSASPKHWKTCYHITLDNSAIEQLNWPLPRHQGPKSKNYGEDGEFYYVPISYAKEDVFTGSVYDKSTDERYYSIPFVVHNSDEDTNTGRPLTGPSGKLLRECIPDEWKDECSFDNIINCRPTDNRDPTWNEIECCRPKRDKFIQEAKPLLIVGLGRIPLQAVLGSQDMQGMRGRIFAVKYGNHACWFLPTYHPSFILRVAKNKHKPLNSMMGHCFRMDLKRAFVYAEWLQPPEILDEKLLKQEIQCFDGAGNQEAKVLALLEQARKAKEKAVDLETKGLRPYKADAAIMSCAFSFENTHFSFALDHPKAGWTGAQKAKIKAALKAAVLTGTKIAHNSPFEVEWLVWYLGRGILQHEEWHCTQMECHFLDERRGKAKSTDDTERRAAYQALDFLVKQHFGISYKSLFKLNKKDMSKSDLGETLLYNGVDTKVTLMLHKRQMVLLKHFGLWEAYLEARPRQTSAAMMQFLGVHVDQAEVKKAQGKLGPEIKQLEADIAALKVVQAYVKDHKEFNPLSTDHAIEIFKDYLHRPEVEAKPERYEAHDFNKSSVSKKRYDDGKGSKFSVDKNVLERIDHPLAKMIVGLRNRTKLKSTYIDSLITNDDGPAYPDGQIHCNFNMTFSETGRTSSDSLNMQNFPQRNDAWVRQQITAPEGHVFVAFDYGQLEACTAAMCSLDKVLTKALWEDYDIHMEWAERTGQLYPDAIGGKSNLTDKSIMKKFRSRIKNKLVFPAVFGAQNSSIAGYLGIPEEVIDDLMAEFWKIFHGLARYQDELMKKYYDVGYVESPTGRRRHYPMTRNQAINDPIQSVACDIVCKSMNTLSQLAAEEDKWHLHPILNIHDDLTFVMPDDDKVLEAAVTDVYKIMLSPGYDFINVPLSVTGSIGKHWYGMTEIGKFWSHKDL